jgi:hypothetical protein
MIVFSVLIAQPWVQTKIGENASSLLQESYDASITVDKIKISLFGQLKLSGVLIKDHHNDTLIAVSIIETDIKQISSLLKTKLVLGESNLYDGVFHMKTYEGEETNNFTLFTRKFISKKSNIKKTPFKLNTPYVGLNNIDFDIVDQNKKGDSIVVYYVGIHGLVKNFKLDGANLSLRLENARFVDDHGLNVKNLTTDFSYSKTQMLFKKAYLETSNSNISTDISFNYKGNDLQDFNNQVVIEAELGTSYVSLLDLKKLYKEFGGNDLLKVKTAFKGTMNDFRLSRFDLSSGTDFIIKGNYHFKEAANQGTEFSVNGISEEITSNYTNLKSLMPNLIGKNLPSELKKIGVFSISGATLITKNILDLAIDIKSKMGVASLDLELTNIDNIDEAAYNGYVNVTDFELGKMIGNPLIGQLSFEGEVKGEGFKLGDINTSLIGIVSKHQYRGYTYRGVQIDGLLKNKLFNGHLTMSDSNISIDFTGLADLSTDVYKFDFNLKVDKLDLKTLHLFERDSISIIKGDIDVDLSGNSLNNIIGSASFKNATYTNEYKAHAFENFLVKSERQEELRTLTFSSADIINGQIKGVFKFEDLGNMVQNSLGSMMANYAPIEVKGNQFIEFDFEIFNEIIPVLAPHVSLLSSATLKGKMLEENNEIKLLFSTPKLKVNRTLLDTINLQLDNKNPSLNTNFSIKEINTPNYTVRDLNLYNKKVNDTLYFRSDFTGGVKNEERYGLVFYYTIDKAKNSVLGILESKIFFKGKEWKINPTGNKNNKLVFNYRKEEYEIKELELLTDGQEIRFDGVIRDSTYKNLHMKFSNVNLDAIMPKVDSLSVGGVLDGALNFKQEDGIYNPLGNLTIKEFTINNSLQGDLNMHVNARDSYKKYQVDISLLNDSFKQLDAVGVIDISPKVPLIDLSVKLDAFNLNAFSPLGKNVLSEIRGVANGEFTVVGPLSNPEMNGGLELIDTGFTFPYLNVDYNLVQNPKVILEKQTFTFDNLVLEDSKHHTTGVINGTIKHSNYKNWSLDLNLKSDRIMVLDTEDGDGVSYYGTGFIKGISKISGTTNDLQIDVKAKTLKGTKFIIPLNDVKAVENSSLIHFKSDDTMLFEESIFDNQFLIEKFQGLSLNFDIDVTPEAEAEIVIDRVSGSSLKGSGTGNLLIEINTKGKFNMYGDYNINKGFYNFIYGGIINKPFEIQQGGVISWDGNPMNANLNIQAIHRVKANPKVLLTDLNTSRKIAVDLVTDISGSLFDSDEDFSIIIPNSSSTVASELSFVLNNDDENATLRQFFSLLIAKSFFNDDNTASNGSSAITGTTSDIISGALSDIFNEEGDKFQIDLGYTAGDKSDVQEYNIDNQVDISLKTQINDKILIDGNLGVPVGTKTQSNVIGEVKVEFLVDDEGRLRYTVFNRQNEVQYSEEEEGYTQGIGLVYQIDFSNLKEMFSKFGFKRKKRNTFDGLDVEQFSDDFILVVPSIL